MKKKRLDVSCEPSAQQRIHMKNQGLFSLKNIEKLFMTVVCCSCDLRLKGECKDLTKQKIHGNGVSPVRDMGQNRVERENLKSFNYFQPEKQYLYLIFAILRQDNDMSK